MNVFNRKFFSTPPPRSPAQPPIHYNVTTCIMYIFLLNIAPFVEARGFYNYFLCITYNRPSMSILSP